MSPDVQPIKKLTPKQTRYMTERAAGKTKTASAAAAGIALKTAVRWEVLPGVQEAIAEEVDRRVREARKMVQAATVEAAQTLRGLLESENERVRLRAAEALLNMAGVPLTPLEIMVRSPHWRRMGELLVDALAEFPEAYAAFHATINKDWTQHGPQP